MDYVFKLTALKGEFSKMELCFKILELCHYNCDFADKEEDKEIVGELITKTLSALKELINAVDKGILLADVDEIITPEMFGDLIRTLKTIGQSLYEVNMRIFDDVLVGLDKVKDYYEDYEDYEDYAE